MRTGVDRLLAEADPTETATIRFQYVCGILRNPDLGDLIAYGRALGLDVRHHRGGGWLERRGWVVAVGTVAKLIEFCDAARSVVDFE